MHDSGRDKKHRQQHATNRRCVAFTQLSGPLGLASALLPSALVRKCAWQLAAVPLHTGYLQHVMSCSWSQLYREDAPLRVIESEIDRSFV